MSIDQLTAEALALPPEERETLVQTLQESLSNEEEEHMDPEYLHEIQRRAEEMRAGVVQGIPHEEVMREVQRIIECD